MTKIEKEIKKALEDFKPGKGSSKELESFLRASEQFEELVKSGILTRRGNHQLSIEDAHLKQYSINDYKG